MVSNVGISLPGEEEAIEPNGSNEDEAIEASSSDGQREEQVIEASGSSEVLVEIETSGSNEDEAIEVSGSDGQTGRDQEEKAKHRFSEPWEDSDLILVVEDEKFHVHRLILSMNSPVFKAMFKSQFKEATSSEIPLPEKKANEMLDFLKRIYFPYIEEQVEITMENVVFLLQLSDEYEVKLVFDPCIKFVKNQPITRANVMKLLKIANLYDLDDVLQGCNDLLKDMKMKMLSETIHLEDLDRENLQHFLEQRIERLETFLDTLYPQFMGLVGYLLLLVHQAEAGKFVSWCPTHVSNGRLYQNYTSVPAFSGCAHCRQMFIQIVSTTYTGIFTVSGRKYRYEGQHHFDESLPSVIDDFRKLVK